MSDALLSAGNMYLLRRDYETALPFYAEIYQRQKNGKASAYSQLEECVADVSHGQER